MRSRIKTLCCESIPLLLLIGLSCLVLSQATNIPFWDEWGMANVFDRYYSGNLTASYFVLGQPEHVLAIPQLIILLLGLLTHWDLRLELLVNLSVGLGIYLLYRAIVLKDASNTTNKNIFLLPAIGAFVFSFIQWHNWIWGWQMQIFISVCAGLTTLAILCLREMTLPNVCCAALCAVIASFSFAAGTPLWFIGAALIALRANKLSLYLVWAIPAGLCLYVYYLIRPTDLVLSNLDVKGDIEYILTYIGSPVTLWGWGLDIAFYIGVFGSGLLGIYLLFNRNFSGYTLFFLSVIALVLMVAALTSVGRPHDFFDEATASRYSSFSIHYWIAIICLLFNNDRQQHLLIKIPKYAIVLIITSLSVFVSYQSVPHFYTKNDRTMIINYFIHPELVQEDQVPFRSIIWNRGELNRKTRLLKKYQLGFYAGTPP